LGCDFLVFSGHKVFAPTGIGILYGKKEWLDKLPPYQGGGFMISDVYEEHREVLTSPPRFRGGSTPISQGVWLGVALEFVRGLGFDRIHEHERMIQTMTEEGLARIGDIRRIGTAPNRSHVVSFLIGSSHPSDVGAILDQQGIAVRAGHHCCQPL